jgi:hypothetical protein
MKWRSHNQLDGTREYLICNVLCAPSLVFTTRDAARAYAKQHYGYIATRRDLRREPHGWRVPQIVKVTVTVTEASRIEREVRRACCAHARRGLAVRIARAPEGQDFNDALLSPGRSMGVGRSMSPDRSMALGEAPTEQTT